MDANAEIVTALKKSPTGMKILVALIATVLVLGGLAVAYFAMQKAIGFLTPHESKGAPDVTVFVTTITSQAKLVVTKIDIKVTVDQGYTTTFLGYKMKKNVQVTVPAAIQYFVMLDLVTVNDVSFDPANKRLTVTVPRPTTNLDYINVDTNPDNIMVMTDGGLRPLSPFNMRDAQDDAMRIVKQAAMKQADAAWVRERAELDGKKELEKFLISVIKRMGNDVTLDVKFK